MNYTIDINTNTIIFLVVITSMTVAGVIKFYFQVKFRKDKKNEFTDIDENDNKKDDDYEVFDELESSNIYTTDDVCNADENDYNNEEDEVDYADLFDDDSEYELYSENDYDNSYIKNTSKKVNTDRISKLKELSELELPSYALLDKKCAVSYVINDITEKNYKVIAELKLNRAIYPASGELPVFIGEYAKTLTKSQFHPVTVHERDYLLFGCVCKINGINEKVTLVLSYPETLYGVKSFLEAYICTDLSLSAAEILIHYNFRKISTFLRISEQ